jgi:hypothetical protein
MVGAVARAPAAVGSRAVRRASLTVFSLALVAALVLAPAAAAHNDGRGFYGATNDKAITNAGFILIVFFPVFVFTMSTIQRLLDKRKQARKAAREALGEAQWRGGW